MVRGRVNTEGFCSIGSGGNLKDSVNLIAGNYMLDEFEKAVKKKEGDKARSVYNKAKHLYDYLSPNEKVCMAPKFKKATLALKKI